MDKSQVVAGMKKNAVSIAAIVVALVALGVTFFVLMPMIGNLDSQVEERAERADTAQSLLTQSRPNVQVNLTSAASTDRPLDRFPTARVIQSGREQMEQVELQAGSVLEAAINVNRQIPLLQDNWERAAEAWPLERRQDDLARQEYQRAYREYVNADGTFSDGNYPSASLQGRMSATRPPSQEEVAQNIETLEARMQAREPLDDSGEPVAEDFEQRLAQARADLATQMKFARARSHLFYIDESNGSAGLDIHELAEAEEPTAEDVFNAQMELWVQENLLENLYRANLVQVQSLSPEERNILNAPIKHILSIEVAGLLDGVMLSPESDQDQGQQQTGDPGGMNPYGGMGGDPSLMGMEGMDPGMMGGMEGNPMPQQQRPQQNQANNRRPGGAASEAPGGLGKRMGGPVGGTTDEDQADMPDVEVPSDPSAPVDREYAYSVTGRPPHTPVYDLIRFNLRLRVEAASVPYVLNQLQAGSLITILNVDVRSVDMAVAADQGYVYGTEPVVELDMQGEAIFLRAWTTELMPTSIEQALAGSDDAAVDESPF